ncbi:MAG: alcohol dehydrogenase [Hyphomicrobiales bacterium]|nr:MAG: alcohol dehydrogenase [Hyphomicrobiales bacterium]
MKVRGAVLETIGAQRPYASSRPITVTEVELDGPGPGEVLVRIEASGVCHSDLSVVDGNRVRPVPMLLGHEACGRIVECGSGVEGFKAGQRVVMTFLPRCGECAECKTDGRLPCGPGSKSNNAGTLLSKAHRLHRDGVDVHHHLGVSGFAEYAVVDQHSIVGIDDDVPPDIAAVMGCAVLTGGGAVLNAGRPQAGQSVMVVGLGGVGLAALITAKAVGDGDVIGVDARRDKLETALELGATAVYTPEEVNAAEITADVVIEAAGNARAFETAVRSTAAGGITVTVGLPAPTAEATISPLQLVAQARTIVGSYLGSAVPSRDIPVFVDLWRQGKLPVEKLISSHIDVSEINSAMDALADGDALRQIISFPEPA